MNHIILLFDPSVRAGSGGKLGTWKDIPLLEGSGAMFYIALIKIVM